MEIETKLVGLSQAIENLNTFERRIARRVLEKAIRAGANPIVEAVQKNAPRATGIFRRSLTKKIKTYSNSGTVVAIIGQTNKRRKPNKSALRRAGFGGISGGGEMIPIHLVENPTLAHSMQPRSKAKTLAGLNRWLRKRKGQKIDETVTARLPDGFRRLKLSRIHKGTRGARFMRKSFRESEAKSVSEFQTVLATEAEREAASLPQPGI